MEAYQENDSSQQSKKPLTGSNHSRNEVLTAPIQNNATKFTFKLLTPVLFTNFQKLGEELFDN